MNSTFPVLIALIPLALGIVWRYSSNPSTNIKPVGLTTIGVIAGGLVFMRFAVEVESSIILLSSAVLLAGFCAILSQEESQHSSAVVTSILIILGLGLGALLNQAIVSRIFLCGLLGFVAISINGKQQNTFRIKLIYLHITLAIIFSISSVFMGEALQMFANLFLALTFLPLVPFHLPFVGVIKDAKGSLPSFWIVVWLTTGLAELNMIYSSLTSRMLFILSLLALISAVYASLASLGQRFNRLFVASATVAHVPLVWGLLEVFPAFPRWGISFGVTLALVMGGISLAFSFIQQRYGWKTIGILPGLASPMPRFGVALVLLVAFALFLPLFQTFSGLIVLPTIATQDVEILMVSFLFLVVWLGGGWYFIQMLHQTAFGEARSDVPYSDLRITEYVAVWALLLGATYSGIIH
jgi:hypothetical protein